MRLHVFTGRPNNKCRQYAPCGAGRQNRCAVSAPLLQALGSPLNIVGAKDCPSCGVSPVFWKSFVCTWVSSTIECASCAQRFTYSNRRRYVGFICVLLIIFSPTLVSFLSLSPMPGFMLYSKYIIAAVVFYLIVGGGSENGHT